MKTRGNLTIDFSVTINLNESEIRALDALAGYGTKEFLEVFYKHMGEHYLKPNEEGLTTLFEKIKELRQPIAAMDELKKTAIETKKKFDS
jgi:predicted ribonuclease YlaK